MKSSRKELVQEPGNVPFRGLPERRVGRLQLQRVGKQYPGEVREDSDGAMCLAVISSEEVRQKFANSIPDGVHASAESEAED